MRTIELVGKSGYGEIALVDECDLELILSVNPKWYLRLTPSGNKYAISNERNDSGRGWHCRLMHHLILRPPSGLVIDHINGNGLDNRRANLRICTMRDNQCNGRGRGNNQYRGVSWASTSRKWQARIRLSPKNQIYLGVYQSDVDAAKAYDVAAKEHFGEYARCNF